MVIILEDNVSKHILSFTKDNFLYTRTVCKVWYKNGNETNTKTNYLRAVDSISTLDEAFEHGYPALRKCGGSYYAAPYYDALENKSGIFIFQHLVENGHEWMFHEVLCAAGFNRVDVLQLYRTNGAVFDARILHEAVQHGHRQVLEYLMGVGCPVDCEVIDWGFGDNVPEELKMRSMEIAVRDGRIDIVKQLRTVDYPFTWDTFTAAINAKDINMLKYSKENADGEFENPYEEDFSQFMLDNDSESVKMLLDNDLICHYDDYTMPGACTDYSMIKLLELYGYRVCERLIDNVILDQRVELARHLVEEYNVCPTSEAYNFVLQDGFEEDVDTLNWLHDEVGCKWDSKDVENILERDISPVVRQWFQDRRRT